MKARVTFFRDVKRDGGGGGGCNCCIEKTKSEIFNDKKKFIKKNITKNS